MKRVLLFFLPTALLLTGCRSQESTGTQTIMQQQAGIMSQQQEIIHKLSAEPFVTVIGDVRYSRVEWNEDLTLARAIVEAEYIGLRDPKVIILDRSGETLRIHPRNLLRGEDLYIEPGDVIEIRR